MTTETREINGYIQNSEGKWVLTETSKQESLRLYYSGRVAYSKENPMHSIGKYNEFGEVIPFKI